MHKLLNYILERVEHISLIPLQTYTYINIILASLTKRPQKLLWLSYQYSVNGQIHEFNCLWSSLCRILFSPTFKYWPFWVPSSSTVFCQSSLATFFVLHFILFMISKSITNSHNHLLCIYKYQEMQCPNVNNTHPHQTPTFPTLGITATLSPSPAILPNPILALFSLFSQPPDMFIGAS